MGLLFGGDDDIACGRAGFEIFMGKRGVTERKDTIDVVDRGLKCGIVCANTR